MSAAVSRRFLVPALGLTRSCLRPAVAVLAATVLMTGCGNDETIEVAAASSLTDVLESIAASFDADGGVDASVSLRFAGSQVLATQIEEGAPIDLFLAADEAQAERVVNTYPEARLTPFAANRVVIAVHADSELRTLDDLTRDGLRIAIGAPSVPVGALTNEILLSLSPELRDGIREHVVTEDPNVRIVRSRLELGEVDAAFIYATDLAGLDDVRAIELPAGFPLNVYVAVLINDSSETTGEFLEFLLGSDAQALLSEAGFIAANDLDLTR